MKKNAKVMNRIVPYSTHSADTILWSDPSAFAAANAAIKHLIDRHVKKIAALRPLAETIHRMITELSPLMNDLCAHTCSFCCDPCCLSATIYFDMTDLIFRHLTSTDTPSVQPMQTKGDVCAYLGPKGCRQPRHKRPWICTWYICATQTHRLNRMPSREVGLKAEISRIKHLRKELEARFITITAPGSVSF